MAVTAVGRTLRLRTDEAPLLPRGDAPQPLVTVSAHDRVVELTPLAEREATTPGDDDDSGGAEGESPIELDAEDDSGELTDSVESDTSGSSEAAAAGPEDAESNDEDALDLFR